MLAHRFFFPLLICGAFFPALLALLVNILLKVLAQPFQSAIVAVSINVLDSCSFTMPGSILDPPWRCIFHKKPSSRLMQGQVAS